MYLEEKKIVLCSPLLTEVSRQICTGATVPFESGDGKGEQVSEPVHAERSNTLPLSPLLHYTIKHLPSGFQLLY